MSHYYEGSASQRNKEANVDYRERLRSIAHSIRTMHKIEHSLDPLLADANAIDEALDDIAALEAQLARAEATYREARNQLAAHGIAEHPGIVTQIDLLAARAQYAESRAVEWRDWCAGHPCENPDYTTEHTSLSPYHGHAVKGVRIDCRQCKPCRARQDIAERAGEEKGR